MESKLEFPQSAILTPYNYFEWKPKIQLHLRSRGLFRITMETEVEPTSAMEKTRYFNRMDEAFGILCLSISPELLFHVESCSTPNEVWKILEGLFGKQDEMQGHILENELNSLDPRNFENIQDFFTRYKALLVQLKGCGIDKSKQENQLILSILSKLGPEYAVFVSTFHTVRSATGAAWKMPSLDSFIQSLMHEQDKLIKMGTLKNSKAHALTVHAKGKANSKDHQKGKGKKDPDPRKGGHPKPPDGSSGSKERKGTKGQSMCNYCHRGFHPESACMKKTIDLMAQTLQQYNLEDHIPENAKKKSEEKAPDPREKARHPRGNGHALIALHSAPQEWIIDSGASHHMASSKESFSFLHAYSGPPILMGDNSAVAATGQGRVQFEDGRFENVLHTPRLAVNLLSVYQMTHTGSGRKVEFTPDSVSIYDMQTNLKIASGKVNDQSRLYTFSDFVPQSDSILLLTHANEDVDLARRMRDNKRDSFDQRPPRGRPPGTSIPKQQQPMGEVEGGHIARSTGRKDRHSKAYTAKGPQDRRVRLSALTAIQFYDVQDRLGFDRPSKAVDWLIKKAKTSIDELNQLPRRSTPNIPNQQPKAEDEGIKDQAEQEIELENEASVKGAGAREADSRAIARERVRERAKERTQERSDGVAKAQTYLRPQSQLFSLNPASTSPTVPNYHLKNGPASENLGTGSNAAVLIMQRFEIHAMLELIQKFKVTVAPIVPLIVLPIAKNPVVEKYDMFSIRMVLSGAAPLEKDLEDALRARIPNATLAQGYGMTEARPVLAMSLGFGKVPFIIKSGSCGTVVRNAEMKNIEPETGVSLPHNHRGEICIRGPQIMKGYLNDPEATEMTIDKDGWLHTRDVGYIDDDEELFIADCVKELIKYKGFQVPPAELEAILLSHPSIADVAVVFPPFYALYMGT